MERAPTAPLSQPPAATPPQAECFELADELDVYLSLPKEEDMDLDVLEWWRVRDRKQPPGARWGRTGISKSGKDGSST
eukprot:scaffold70821_cov32-Tisochrysis_lutea.AAC.3